ncbi:hypothetical protein [uncultured Thiocystis sp.]|jgi:hypothetical protein|uniref:hypothetical protein n=1 Tax=uncultured Thiocystis sp. TaxID=1202134 RepID=UPI0025D496E5|nr:hypothetical protein [uncultured Thiocystis sp.]
MTELLLHLDQPLAPDLDPAALDGLTGLVVDVGCFAPMHCLALCAPVVALCGTSPGDRPDWDDKLTPLRVVDQGLEVCARLRDAHPERAWLPRLIVDRQAVSYRMSNYRGEGFKFFTPDSASIQGYRVTDGDRPLAAALKRAQELGFARLWLHARDAAQQGKGLDLDLLERAQRDFPEKLWISGGATEPRHLENLTREGGATGLVIGTELLARTDIATLLTALTPLRAPETLPETPVQVKLDAAAVTG